MVIRDVLSRIMNRSQAQDLLVMSHTSRDLEDQMDAMQAYEDACDDVDKHDYLRKLTEGFDKIRYRLDDADDQFDARQAYREACEEFDETNYVRLDNFKFTNFEFTGSIRLTADEMRKFQAAIESPGFVMKNVVA